MLTKLARHVRAGDRLLCDNPRCECLVIYVQECSTIKRPERCNGLINAGLKPDDAILIEYRVADGPSKGYHGSQYLHLDQRIRSA